MDSKDDILEVIKSLEKKFDALQSREERDRQYKIMGYSIILAAVLSTLIYISFRIVEAIIPQSKLTSILLLIAYFFLIVFAYYLGNVKKIYRVGDYVIRGNINPKESEYKKKMLESISKIAKIDGKCQIANVQMSGLSKIDYIFRTFREDYIKKLNYLNRNVEYIKGLDYFFGNFNNSSFISLSFVDNDFVINLSTKHFNLNKAKEIFKNTTDLEQNNLINDLICEGF